MTPNTMKMAPINPQAAFNYEQYPQAYHQPAAISGNKFSNDNFFNMGTHPTGQTHAKRNPQHQEHSAAHPNEM
jgi:hypothetical protein